MLERVNRLADDLFGDFFAALDGADDGPFGVAGAGEAGFPGELAELAVNLNRDGAAEGDFAAAGAVAGLLRAFHEGSLPWG